MSSEKIEFYTKKISELKNLPTLPVIATEIMRITRNDNYSAGQIQNVIEKDPPLAMKLLKVANSAYYGTKQPVKSLRHAVVVIGMSQLSNIAVSFSVLKRFDNQSSDINWEKFWEHSIAVGFVSELLVEEYGIITKESPYSIGLLHDIGKLVLNILEPEKFIDVYNEVKNTQKSFFEAETEIFGVTHCDVGKILAEKWKMSGKIIDIVQNHHNVEESLDENRIIGATIEIADYVCNVNNLAFGTDFDLETLPVPKSWNILQESIYELENKEFNAFIEEIRKQVNSIAEMVKIIQR